MINLKQELLNNGLKVWSKDFDNGSKVERIYFNVDMLNKIYKDNLEEGHHDKSLNTNTKSIQNSKNYYDINKDTIVSDTGVVRVFLRDLFGSDKVN